MSGPRGPAPTPTAILKLHESRVVEKREKQKEPKPERGKPAKPKHVQGEANSLWNKLTKLLDNMGVLTKIDGGQLERYCRMFVQWRQLQRILEVYESSDAVLRGALARDDSRPVIRNAWSESHRLDSAMKQIEAQFGLTPAARARLSCLVNGSSEPVNQDDREEMFFSGAG